MRNIRGYSNRNPFHVDATHENVTPLSVETDVVTETIQSIFNDLDSVRLLYDVSEFQFSNELKLNDPLIAHALLNADFPTKLEITIYDGNKTVLRHYRTSGQHIRMIRQTDSFHTRVVLMVNERLRNRNLHELYQMEELNGSNLTVLNKSMIGLLDQL